MLMECLNYPSAVICFTETEVIIIRVDCYVRNNIIDLRSVYCGLGVGKSACLLKRTYCCVGCALTVYHILERDNTLKNTVGNKGLVFFCQSRRRKDCSRQKQGKNKCYDNFLHMLLLLLIITKKRLHKKSFINISKII